MKTPVLFLLYSCLAMVTYTSIAQEGVLIKGTILNDSIDKGALNIVNLSLKVGTITDTNGQFEIPSRLYDTLNISGIQYEPRAVVISKKVYDKETLKLYLIPKITTLDEVHISNITLSGNLVLDAHATKIPPQITAKDLGLPENKHPVMTPEQRRYYSAVGGAGAFGALLNAISGRTKQLKKHLEISILQAKIQRNRQKFSDSLYIKSLGIPETLIEDFVYYVFEDKEAIATIDEGDLLNLLEYMLTKTQSYIEIKEAEGTVIIRPNN